MRKSLVLLVSCCSLFLTFCTALPSTVTAPPIATTEPPTVTSIVAADLMTPTLTPSAAPNVEPSQTPMPDSATGQQFIAYAQDGQLLVTNVTGGVQGGTTQYTLAGIDDQVSDIVWSPSGEFIAYVSNAVGEPHVFYIFALGQSTPTDLGPGSTPAWSPDSQSIAYVRGPSPDDNIWVTTIENPSPRQLTFQTNYAWGRPVFTPDGQSLIVAGTDRLNLGAQGNTNFTLETLALDGSGARAPLPGTTPLEGVRLPYDLRFSPDAQKLAFSASYHLSACASPSTYYVSSAAGGPIQPWLSPILRGSIDENRQRYHVGAAYAWFPTSDALILFGAVVDCDPNSATMGQIIAGPQMSVMGLDGNERTLIPGYFMNPSMDRTATWVAAAHYQDYQDTNPQVEIYDRHTGQRILSLGSGSYPALQP